MALGGLGGSRIVTRRAIFLASATFIPPVVDVEVWLLGGGGSGKPGTTQGNGGRGVGGQGGELKHRLLQVVPGQSYAVTIGAGGVSPAGSTTQQTGVNGSASSLGSLLTALGGAGGGLALTSQAPDPAYGGPGADAYTDAFAANLAGIVLPGLDGVHLAATGSPGYQGTNTVYNGGRGGVGGGGAGGGTGLNSGLPDARLIADVGSMTTAAYAGATAASYRGGDGVANTGSGGGGGGAQTTNGYYGQGGTGGSGLLIAQWQEQA